MNIIETVENYDHLLTVEDLEKITQISSKTLYRHIKQRKLPAIRIGGLIRLEPMATAKWLRSRLS